MAICIGFALRTNLEWKKKKGKEKARMFFEKNIRKPESGVDDFHQPQARTTNQAQESKGAAVRYVKVPFCRQPVLTHENSTHRESKFGSHSLLRVFLGNSSAVWSRLLYELLRVGIAASMSNHLPTLVLMQVL
ncbi:hypothetical protein ACLOJK_032906 [Asimina triloba]